MDKVNPPKRCPTCKELLPGTLEFWSRDKSRDDGLCYECKSCRNAKRRRFYAETDAERCKRHAENSARTYARKLERITTIAQMLQEQAEARSTIDCLRQLSAQQVARIYELEADVERRIRAKNAVLWMILAFSTAAMIVWVMG